MSCYLRLLTNMAADVTANNATNNAIAVGNSGIDGLGVCVTVGV